MIQNEWKRLRKSGGPGGYKCPCCNYWNCHPRKSKPLERRSIRRRLKQSDRKEPIDE